jgi:hypothetical protein
MAGARRSGRIAREISIDLSGTDTSGRLFTEQTKTVVLSRHGAGILSSHKLASDELLTIRLSGTSAEAKLRLVGQMGQETRGYTYGVEFLDPQLDFWELRFPPPPQWHSDPDSALECSICHDRQLVAQTEIEADVYALLHNILRFCQRCGTSTVWRAAAGGAAATSDAPAITLRPSGVPPVLVAHAAPQASELSSAASLFADSYAGETLLALVESEDAVVEQHRALPPPAPQPPSPAPGKLNRRRHLRSGVHFTARVRCGELSDEIAECDDISKGGFSFRSLKSYPLNSQIAVAVPYSPGWDAIYVPACIKHIDSLPGGALFRYGAAYITPPKRQP